MNDREILAAVLRWSTAYEARRAIGAEKRRLDKLVKSYYEAGQYSTYNRGYSEACSVRSAADDAATRLTPARRKEQAAIRALAKVCATVRSAQHQVADANVIDCDLLQIAHESRPA